MIIEDLWTDPGPSRRDLDVLDRLASRRAAIEAVEPADEDQASVRAHLLETLDVMEEALCESPHAGVVDEGWQELEAWEPWLLNGHHGNGKEEQ